MTDFLYDPGTNGLIVSPLNLLTTELNSLANGNTVLSSVGGSSGKFTQANTGSALLGGVYFTAGGAFTPATGGCLFGWFVRSPDGGSNYERIVTNTANPRPPDFTIPLFTAAYASGDIGWCLDPKVRLPPEDFKVLIQNAPGVTLPASGNTIKLAPIGVVRA
jgi:hypothetical protein